MTKPNQPDAAGDHYGAMRPAILAFAAASLACVTGESSRTSAGGSTGAATGETNAQPQTPPDETTGAASPAPPATSTSGEASSSEGSDSGFADASTSGPPPACGNGLCADDEDATACCEDCGVCDEVGYARIETGVVGGMPGIGVTPGGMASTHSHFDGGPFTELVFPFTIEEDPIESSWFWAQQFFFEGTNQGGYTGLQANGIMLGLEVGKMAIVSIWDAVAAVPGPDASCEAFGAEGAGYSCRMRFEWRENVTYRMSVREAAPSQWALDVHDPATGEMFHLGTIEVDPTWGHLRPYTGGFAEYYGPVDSCETTPHAVAVLHQPLGDDTEPVLMAAETYGPCEAQATSSCVGPACN